MSKSPENSYKKRGWNGYIDFLGYNKASTRNRKYFSFLKSRKFARSKNFKTIKEWHQYKRNNKKTYHLPYKPDRVYKNKGWKSWKDFLGKSYNPFYFKIKD